MLVFRQSRYGFFLLAAFLALVAGCGGMTGGNQGNSNNNGNDNTDNGNGNGNDNGPDDPQPSADALPDFSLPDVNPNSVRFGDEVSPRDYLAKVSAWYFGAAT